MTDPLNELRQLKLVPVVVLDDAAQALPLAEALLEGGLPCAEVTFRTPAAAEALARMSEAFPELLLGAGTVLTPQQVRQAHEAGARFVVAPGFNPRVVDACQERGLPVYPGVATPSEIEQALEKGLRVLKFFPAEPLGGVAYLRAISAPYGALEFMPTGGIHAGNLAGYLGFPKVVACGGSWMVAPEWLKAGDFARVRQAVAEAVRTVHEITGES